jgi:threonyl-tRNA synthetase
MGDDEVEYCPKIADRMTAMAMRAEIDKSINTVGYKIRAAEQEKVPYMLVVGGTEIEHNADAVRSRKDGEKGVMPVDQFISEIMMEIAEKRR